MAVNPAALQISLNAAKLSATYINKDLDFICAVLKNCLTQMPSHQDIKDIFQVISHGPFLTPIASISPHNSQRPIVPSHIELLVMQLLGQDMRKVYPAFIFVPTAEWEAHLSPALEADPPLSSIPLFTPSKAVSVTHGHRFYALLEAVQGDKKEKVVKKYGNDLLWVTYLLPDILFNSLPPIFWNTFILKDNMKDRSLLGLTEDQSAVTWVGYLSQVYQHLFFPQGQFQPLPSNDPRLKDLIPESRKNYMGGIYAKITGLYALWHPKVLPLLGQAMTTTIGKNYMKLTILGELANSNIWPMCVALEVGLAQLEPLADVPWRKELSLVHLTTKHTISLGTRSSYGFKLNMLRGKVKQGYVFSWLKDTLSQKEARAQTLEILDRLEPADPDTLPPHLVQVMDGSEGLKNFMKDPDFAIREPSSFRLMHTPDESSWLLWTGLFSSGPPSGFIKKKFQDLTSVMHVLTWLLLGPEVANTLNNKRGYNKATFGHIPWRRCADGIILAYLATARKASPQQLYPLLPSHDTSIHQLYAEAHPGDLTKLNKLASALMDTYSTLLVELKVNLRHVKTGRIRPLNEGQVNFHPVRKQATCPFFFWNSDYVASHKFSGPDALDNRVILTHPITPVGLDSDTHVYYGAIAQGQEEQSAVKYAEAVQYVTGHQIWRWILYHVLEVDQLVIPGQPWFYNPLARIFPKDYVDPADVAYSEAQAAGSDAVNHFLATGHPSLPPPLHIPTPPQVPSTPPQVPSTPPQVPSTPPQVPSTPPQVPSTPSGPSTPLQVPSTLPQVPDMPPQVPQSPTMPTLPPQTPEPPTVPQAPQDAPQVVPQGPQLITPTTEAPSANPPRTPSPPALPQDIPPNSPHTPPPPPPAAAPPALPPKQNIRSTPPPGSQGGDFSDTEETPRPRAPLPPVNFVSLQDIEGLHTIEPTRSPTPPTPPSKSAAQKGKKRARSAEAEDSDSSSKRSKDQEEEDEHMDTDWNLLNSRLAGNNMAEEWLEQQEVNRFMEYTLDLSPRPEGVWIKPLENNTIPPLIHLPNHPQWQLEPADIRSTVMASLAGHFPPEVHAFLQSGSFEVMKLLEHVGKEFGNNSKAFEQVIRDLRVKCNSIKTNIRLKEGAWEKIPEDAEPLKDFSIGETGAAASDLSNRGTATSRAVGRRGACVVAGGEAWEA
ncbi:hypothetical protein GY45DRAFT_1341347 [Cubamyces sp. BRFM 1775]|nr:hypothetical protein GY45DRAFT_1341347 [Cubamyces sp. BRFM 1775]